MNTASNHTTLSLLNTWLAGLALALLCVLLQLYPLLSPHLSTHLGPHLGPSLPVAQQAQLWLQAMGLQLHHTSWAHLALNLAGLGLLLWGFLPTCGAKVLAMALAWGLAWVAAWVLWVEPLAWYMGLSGALHAMLATALVLGVRNCLKQPHPEGQTLPLPTLPNTRPMQMARLALGLIALGLLIKLGLEWHTSWQTPAGSRAVDAWLGAPVAYEAHRGGALGGLVLGLGLVGLAGLGRLMAPGPRPTA